MDPGPASQPSFFIPALSSEEAVTRVFSLTGGQPHSRGEKRALLALRDALGLDVDVVRTNAVLGAHLAQALDVEWRPDQHTLRHRVTLNGLNALLEGATEAYQAGSLRQVAQPRPASLTGPGWGTFNPAVSKIEAVTRIARLTNSPEEWLGPGSKEHKSVLTNLADRLLPDKVLDQSSKTRLGRDIAAELGVTWTDRCYSTGETISLEGLNLILAGAERRLSRLGVTAAEMLADPHAEGQALAATLYDGWKAEPWDGRTSIGWMQQRGVRGANDTEWQGWYYEARGRELLNAAFPPNRQPVQTRYGNTTFDYSLNYVWDLKAHTHEQAWPVSQTVVPADPGMLLNDEQAIRDCVSTQGLGFLVLNGRATMDEDGTFLGWHRDLKAAQGIKTASSNSGRSRTRKTAFAPLTVEAYWLANTPALQAALAAGQLKVARQGRQAPNEDGGPGAERATKLAMDVTLARHTLLVGERSWVYRPTQDDESREG